MQPRDVSPDVLRKLAASISAHEGDYDSVNRNTDNQGASVGIYQWAQRPGALYVLLHAYFREDAALFKRIFGSAWAALLEATKRKSMKAVAGALLWEEPWVTKFKLAGREPVFQRVQDRLAQEGVFMRSAFAAAGTMQFYTLRSLALTLDTATQQGPETAEIIARKTAKELEGRTVPQTEALKLYVEIAARPYRRLSAPTQAPSKPHLSWKKIGNEWHLFSGKVNLYRNIVARRMKLVTDPGLSDAPIQPQSSPAPAAVV